MRVRRHVAGQQRHVFDPADLTDGELREAQALAPMERYPALKVGQSKGGNAVAAVDRPEQSKKRRVLLDRQDLSVAKRPAKGREVKTEHPDFSEIWTRH